MDFIKYVTFLRDVLENEGRDSFIKDIEDKSYERILSGDLHPFRFILRHVVFTKPSTQDNPKLIAAVAKGVVGNIIDFDKDVFWSCFTFVESQGWTAIRHVPFCRNMDQELSKLVKTTGSYNFEKPGYDRNAWFRDQMEWIMSDIDADDYQTYYQYTCRGNEYTLRKNGNAQNEVSLICPYPGSSGYQINIESNTFRISDIYLKTLNLKTNDERANLISYFQLLGKKYKDLCYCLENRDNLNRHEVYAIIVED